MNDSKAAGIFDQAKGKLKQAVGETFNDQSMANSGAADEVKGHAEQAWGSVKDAAHDVTHGRRVNEVEANNEVRAQNADHNVRESVTTAAANAKESLQRGLGHLEHKANH
jgi:uncharacterized protein YjbJ (UPF0337 family)